MIQKISEIEGEPEVGKFYLVPCVLQIPFGWRPVIGPAHDDIEYFNFGHVHYHYDWRFITRSEHKRIAKLLRGSNETIERCMSAIVGVEQIILGPELKRRKCVRRTPTFGLDYLSKLGKQKWAKFEKGHVSQQLPSCLRCPHRGAPLGNLPKDEGGNIVCPLHGLKWNLETGKLVSRLG